MSKPSMLWTVGHSTRSTNEFLDMLHAHGITCLADVRRFAGSRAFPRFNHGALERALGKAGISYAAMPDLGGRRKPRSDSPHAEWRNDAFRGYADYMDTPQFAAAAEQLAAMAHEHRVAVMCAEAVWWRCHRSMISDYFKAHGWEVLHILGMSDAKEHPYTAVAKVLDGQLTY